MYKWATFKSVHGMMALWMLKMFNFMMLMFCSICLVFFVQINGIFLSSGLIEFLLVRILAREHPVKHKLYKHTIVDVLTPNHEHVFIHSKNSLCNNVLWKCSVMIYVCFKGRERNWSIGNNTKYFGILLYIVCK